VVSTVGDDPFTAGPTPDEIEGSRLDTSWRDAAARDTVSADTTSADTTSAGTASADTTGSSERLQDITAAAANRQDTHLPLSGDVAGPSVFRVQVLLDRSGFSPGIIDGRWGKNTEKAVYWLQKREGLSATGTVDRSTLDRLTELARRPEKIVTGHQLSEDDVSGPFVDVPEDIYAKAELECMCYESLAEKLGEQFHMSPDLLQQLNPDVALEELQAGDVIQAPNLLARDTSRATSIQRLAISDGGHYVHALSETGRILYHFPSTLGSSYAPSPEGTFEINSITERPWWHYQPDILEDVDDSKRDARIPPGPNNAVGLVWIDLSKPHYGIHGTSAPETIGYATSAGCVRLTNWDALFLARHLRPGMPVVFTDIKEAA
jgi:lipoprotein-anchoring transpeptidase ErfK/SrfK